MWCATVYSVFWNISIVEPLGRHVIDGDRVKRAVLDRIVEQRPRHLEAPVDRASYRRAMAAIDLGRFESATDRADARLDELMDLLDASTKELLSASPAEPYFWFVRYWLLNVREGFSEKAAASLAMSYRVGPYEGWISLARNRFALAIFNQLPEALQREVAAEFAGMVRSWMIGPAATNMETVGWSNRDALIRQLDAVPIAQKTTLVTTLERDGFMIKVPGVEEHDPRPWR
ncbi:hypothetical protein JQ596_30495 [Bradyrhizobium manausense]|uniref:hypothetical protein n=1 Tax=Bradyrhizobium manausense TaxID=989370 RepID=UPI001BA74803|nr:hypothetical protein [Bradyrhizobium manausense]MBR0829867.1 hypothetical protein [Bradyrhizobium manausense]